VPHFVPQTGVALAVSNPQAGRSLIVRGGWYHYKRRVPAEVEFLDDRAPHIRVSLKTKDLATALAKRDALEAADNAFWASLLSGDGKETAKQRYQSAIQRARALGYSYRLVADLATADDREYVKRLEAISDYTSKATEDALLGQVERPQVTVREALKIYLEEITPHQLAGKSEAQKRQWRKIPQRSVNNFVEINGDVAIGTITREQALAHWRYWATRIAPKPGQGIPTHTASSGNRDIGSMRVLFREYFRHIDDRDRRNPFDGLAFDERSKRLRHRRPPFPVAWIKDKLLAVGAFASLNDEARGIILAIMETGARPSEICNLDRNTIMLDAEVPHISVEPRSDPDDPREIKTDSSVRLIPLVGVALAVFTAHPDGFPSYRNREATLSATLNKHLRANGLLPTPAHKVYSLRHSFEDRMKDGDFDTELRMMLMGHAIDRPSYGVGGGLAWRHEALKRIALPFDPSIV
jgi:integrase